MTSRDLLSLFGWAIAMRLVVLLVGYLSVFAFGYAAGELPSRIAASELGNLPGRWDTGWYVGIANGGYRRVTAGQRYQNVAFFPAYPLLLRGVTAMLGTRGTAAAFVWTGVGLSILLFAVGAVYVGKLAELYGADTRQAIVAVALVSAYPFAVFFNAVYSESLFLLASAGACYHAKRNQPMPTGLWGLVAGLTRPTGMLLTIPLALLLWCRPIETEGPGRRPFVYLWPLAPATGALLYSIFLLVFVGNPAAWVHAQELWGRSPHSLAEWVRQVSSATNLVRAEQLLHERLPDVLNTCAAIFAIGMLPLVAIRLGAAMAWLTALNILPALVFGGVMSMGRFTSVLFPVFITLGLRLRSDAAIFACLSAWSLLQAFVAAMFFSWRSIY